MKTPRQILVAVTLLSVAPLSQSPIKAAEAPLVAEPVGIATGDLRRFRLTGFDHNIQHVRFLNDAYVASTSRGSVLTSRDARTWQAATVRANTPLNKIFFDGTNTLVASEADDLLSQKMFLSSTAGKWESRSGLSRFESLERFDGGVFGLSNNLARTIVFGPNALETKPHTFVDGRLTAAFFKTTLVSNGCAFLLTHNALWVSRDRELWRREFFLSVDDVGEVWLAEGNGSAVLLVEDKKAGTSQLRAQQDGGAWTSINVPWQRPRGLAFGLGRFVVLAEAAGEKPTVQLFESAEGATWTAIAEAPVGARAVAFGPAGFVVGAAGGGFAVFAPAPRAAKPVFVRAAIEIPAVELVPPPPNNGKRMAPPSGPSEAQTRLTGANDGKPADMVWVANALVFGGQYYRNPWQAERLIARAMEAKEPSAPSYAAMVFPKMRTMTPEEIVALHQQGADWGNIESMISLGRAYFEGKGVPHDAAAGEKWLRAAIAKGRTGVQTILDGYLAAEARVAARLPLDRKVGPVKENVFDALAAAQNSAEVSMASEAASQLLVAVWRDTNYSLIEQDLGRELAAAESRPIAITSDDGRALSFTKPLDAKLSQVLPNFFPPDFDPAEAAYYIRVFKMSWDVGILIVACHNIKGGDGMMARQIASTFRPAAGSGRLGEFIARLEKSHNDADPAHRAEFRAVVKLAVVEAKSQKVSGLEALETQAWLNPPAP